MTADCTMFERIMNVCEVATDRLGWLWCKWVLAVLTLPSCVPLNRGLNHGSLLIVPLMMPIE